MKYEKITKGYKCGRWTVLGDSPISFDGKHPKWLCECSCPAKTQRYVDAHMLKTKESMSCGCLKHEKSKALNSFTSETFYQWCNRTGNMSFVDRWDYTMNAFNPDEISCKSQRKMFFKCDKNEFHKSEAFVIGNITSGRSNGLCKQCLSFGQWCVNNNRSDILSLWDNELNEKSPFDVPKSGKYYFACPVGKHKSEQHGLNHIVTTNGEVSCVHCASFAEYYGQPFLERYWDYKKNDVSPYDIARTSNKKVWIKCENKKHESYHISLNHFFEGKRCPYCAHQKLHIEDSLGIRHPKSLEVWSNSNKITPYDVFPYSSQKVYWECENHKHEKYLRGIDNATNSEFRCPECVIENKMSVIQRKMQEYLHSLPYTIAHEYNCSITCKNSDGKNIMPYDNEIKELKLLIEVNGIQHYEIGGFHKLQALRNGTTPEAEFRAGLERDKIKKDFAIKNGYDFLSVPYWLFDNNDSYKDFVKEKISKINK